MLALSLIIIGIVLRFAPHAPNVTPVAAIALFGSVYLKRNVALMLPLALMMVSDIFIGMHDVVAFTWGSFILTAMIGLWIKQQRTLTRIMIGSCAASLLFFVISNFGVWAMGWYPKTLQGLFDCYIMAIPFLRDFTVSTLAYSAVFFGAYEFIAQRVKGSKLAFVLLRK
ncbi:MAG: hypothetical protein KBA46_06890 [Candidatus Omnitrophica bacterium]|nr:hypothetical protein [Candidatus Omnitrophota bacterium]